MKIAITSSSAIILIFDHHGLQEHKFTSMMS